MKNSILFILPAIIWGVLWYVVSFQVGTVDPVFSIAYRFFAAAIIAFIVCLVAKLKLRFSLKAHFFFLVQGIFMFAINNWMFYTSEKYMKSGLVGPIFALLVFMNIINSRIFLKTPFDRRVILGGVIGIAGVMMIFMQDFASHFNVEDPELTGIIFALIGTYFASIGNITSLRNQKAGLPVFQVNAYSMLYASVFIFAVGLIEGKTPTFEYTNSFLASFAFLTIFGSVIAYGCYLKLVGNIGAGKAAYVALCIPLVSLGISSIFEGYEWTTLSIIGTLLIIAGNVLSLSLSQRKGEAATSR